MDDMTKSEFWCEFGCEVRIYYDRIEFSDGLQIPIPRDVETDKIHNCPNLDSHREIDTENKDRFFMPEDQDVYQDMAFSHSEQGGHFWDYDEMSAHFDSLAEGMNGIDGLEFKIYRHDVKERLVKVLNNVPEFYDEVTISGESEPLPACLKTSSVEVPGDYNDIGTFQPAALLGLFYEMDGSLEDAKKCFKIQTEVSSDFKTDIGSQKDYWQNRIEEIDQQIRMGKQKSLIEKQTDEESKKPRTSQQEQDQFSLQAVISKTYDFELDDLRRYAFDKITKNDMKAILKKTPWYNHKDKTLIDKVREMQAKEENDTILPLDPTDWDYLDLFDKIKILNPYINRNIKDYLQTIRRHRNITSHPKRYKKQDLEQRNKMIILYIQECKNFFEKSEQR